LSAIFHVASRVKARQFASSTDMNDILKESIGRQRNILKSWLSTSLGQLADDCKKVWPDRQALESRLVEKLVELP
jgi:hypothetical protein